MAPWCGIRHGDSRRLWDGLVSPHRAPGEVEEDAPSPAPKKAWFVRPSLLNNKGKPDVPVWVAWVALAIIAIIATIALGVSFVNLSWDWGVVRGISFSGAVAALLVGACYERVEVDES
jgi:hypothetical protein